jgi:uncharacterized protein (TIGR03437 family)
MKLLATSVALLAVSAASSFAGESAVKAKKAPFYRPHYNARKAIGVRPRASGGAVIVNAASYEEGVSPGGLATILGAVGQNLTNVTGPVYAYANPLPDQLDGTEVFVNGIPAPIYSLDFYQGQDYINIQVPYDAPTGPSAAEIQVVNQGIVVADFFTDSFTEDPGIFVYNGSFAIAEASDYSLIGPDNPAIPGETLVLYVTGLGPLNDPNLVDGYGSPTSPPFAETLDPFQVVLDNENCHVDFSGLAPGFVGLYQINFDVPVDAAAGNLDLSIQSTYANSRIATLPVR